MCFTFYFIIIAGILRSYGDAIELNVDWGNIMYELQTETTLQVVVNALLTRESPIHDESYQMLANLNANYVRFVPWFPYPRYGVAQLQPPSGKYLCNHLNGDSNDNNWTVSLQCPGTSVINEIGFASWGTPSGYCGDFTIGTCHANNSMDIAKTYCMDKNSCTIPVNIDTFNGDPCYGVVKEFAIQVECSVPYNYSNWNFTLIDPLMVDFMNAVNPNNTANKTVINFSTQPNWFYKGVTYGSGYTDNPNDCSWGYPAGTEWIDSNTPQKIGEYYGNLINWYKNGGFIDEYGNEYKSNHHMIIDTWEILNEVESEHDNTPQSYTILYDNIVEQIRKLADPKHEIKFMGMALGGHNEWNWYNYFLNISNHASNDIPLDYISFHFYASSKSRTNPIDFEQFFPDADTFFIEVQNITKIRDKLSPETKIDIDEMGVILPNDNTPGVAIPPAIYWNAAGAMFAYCFGKLSALGIDILGESQFMGYPEIPESEFPSSPDGLPPQFPSVTEIDWNTGVGNARYWILKLLIDHFHIGMKAVDTRFNSSNEFFAQGFMDPSSQTNVILLVNKIYNNITINYDGLTGGKLYYIDERTGNKEAIVYNFEGNLFNLSPFCVGVLYPYV